MIVEFLLGLGIASVVNAVGEMDSTKVERGKDFLGRRFRKTTGPCFSCGGSGSVGGSVCRKCGGSGRYERIVHY